MSVDGNLLRLVEDKLAEKDEVIFEQQRQIAALEDRLRSGGGGVVAGDDKDELIREQMQQILELTERIATLEAGGGGNGNEQDEVVHEQMQQILELMEQVETLEARVKELGG